VYDCTRRDSFERLNFWMEELKVSDISNEATFMLLGCKADQETAKVVQAEEAQAFAAQHRMVFFEASSSTGEHVHESMGALFFGVYRTAHPETHESVVVNSESKKDKDKKGCAC